MLPYHRILALKDLGLTLEQIKADLALDQPRLSGRLPAVVSNIPD